MVERRLLRIDGVVQGVGFRPHVHRVATELELSGLVRNDAAGVVIEIEGNRHAVRTFPERLLAEAPPLASVQHLVSRSIPTRGPGRFVIEDSEHGGQARALISPDVATCDACAAEIADPADRRYRYPFTNCTDCGPRFTIVRHVPYDRDATTMDRFAMCDACRREYHDPSSRRFHAEPIACHDCGPSVWLVHGSDNARGEAALTEAVRLIATGGIVALKGLGGYHLACDAASEESVRRLRRRKGRDAKPLAVMVRDVADLRRLVTPCAVEMRLLTSRERPIVLASRHRSAPIADAVAHGSPYLGVMLPYTPLHHLVLEAAAGPLVMTSGNLADDPIVVEDDDARGRLGDIADAVLGHDRPIETRCDDSVLRVVAGGHVFVRRSRGYVPTPIPLSTDSRTDVLAVGGHLKNTFCVARGRQAFVSHHIGDLSSLGALESLKEGIAHFLRLFEISPDVVAHDLHPDYGSSRLAAEFTGVDRVAVQHHHAHVASAVAEHGLTGPVLGVVFDGAGLGTDGAVWGGEFLLVDGACYERLAHLAYVPLPGGDRAAREPWRMAASHLAAAYGGLADAPLVPRGPSAEALSALSQIMDRGVNSPPTSSVGRLFDAVAALIGLRHTARFEAQAAMELEAVACEPNVVTYDWDWIESGSMRLLDVAPMIRGVVEDVRAGRDRGHIAGAFHDTLAAMVHDTVRVLSRRTGVRTVVLTGGVFQNAGLTERAMARLATDGFDARIQRAVPCNDGGLSLGQAHVARSKHGSA